MSKSRRKQTPAVAAARAKGAREIDSGIHQGSGLPYRALNEFTKAEIRYCIWQKTPWATKVIFQIASTDDAKEIPRLERTIDHVKTECAKTGTETEMDGLQIGLCQVTLLTAARAAQHAKYRQWITDINPEF